MANVSAAVKFFPTAQEGFVTTTSGSTASGAATVGLNSVAGYSNGDVVALVIDPTDATKKQVFTGTVDTAGVQITGVKWTEGTNQIHTAGATVVDYETATAWALYRKGLLVQHNDDGTHGAVTATSVASSGAVSGTSGTFSGTLTANGGLSGFAPNKILNPYKFSVYRNGAWTTGNNAYAKVQFETELYDTNNDYDAVTNHRYTAPVAGFYQFTAMVTSNTVANGAVIGVGLYKNGSEIRRLQFNDQVYRAAGTSTPTVGGTATLQLAASDYIEVYYYGNNNPGNTGSLLTNFSGHLISGT